MKRILIIVMSLIIAGCGSQGNSVRSQNERTANNKIRIAVFENLIVSNAQFTSVNDPSSTGSFGTRTKNGVPIAVDKPEKTPEEDFLEYKARLPWKNVPESEIKRLEKVCAESDNYIPDSRALCFTPGMALRLDTNLGKIRILVCLACRTVEFNHNDHFFKIFLSDDGLDRWKAIYFDYIVSQN
jgi:hypothetical protein